MHNIVGNSIKVRFSSIGGSSGLIFYFRKLFLIGFHRKLANVFGFRRFQPFGSNFEVALLTLT